MKQSPDNPNPITPVLEKRHMTETPERKLRPGNWLKALLLSPGPLFCAGYFLLYALTNIHLNGIVKEEVAATVEIATGHRYDLSIERLNAGFAFNSVTLEHLEIVPVDRPLEKRAAGSVRIRELHVRHLDLSNLLFSRETAARSTLKISRHILDSNRTQLLSARISEP